MFSIVNIYKTLNKLFKIAFYNLLLHASKMRGTLKSHSDLPCVTEYRSSLSNEDQEPLVSSSFSFFSLLLFFKFPSSLLRLEIYRGVVLQSGETVDSTLYFSFSIYVQVLLSHLLPSGCWKPFLLKSWFIA